MEYSNIYKRTRDINPNDIETIVQLALVNGLEATKDGLIFPLNKKVYTIPSQFSDGHNTGPPVMTFDVDELQHPFKLLIMDSLQAIPG